MRQPYPLTYHKAGDTWDRTQRYTLPAGTWTATSTARTADGTLVQTFACALTTLSADPDGYTHALNTTATAADTADWPLATLLADVVFTDASATPVRRSASAFQIASCAYLPEVVDDYTNLAVIPGDLLAVLRGEQGPAGADSTVPGPAGADSTVPGPAGADGVGVPAGGSTGQVLAKKSAADHDTEWVNQTGGTGTGATNLAYTASATGGTVTSDTGTDATIPLADGTNAGLMAPAQHTKLAGIAAGATAVAVDAAPTDGSSNAVSSNGVFDALAGKADTGHNHSGTYDPAGTASSAVSTHVGLADPHTQYALESALGTAAALNVPATGDAASGEVVKGSDSRLSDARTPTAHSQAASTISDSTTVGRAVLTATDAAAARSAIGAGTSSFDGAYSSLSGKPTLGDAAAKNTGTAAGTVAAGDHTHSAYAGTGAIGSSGLTMATAKLLGRSTAATGAVEEITLGTNLSFSGTTLNAAGGSGTKTLAVFSPLANQPPASSFATLDTRNSVPVLDFDAAADESAVFSAVVPEAASLTSGIVANIVWMATSATSGNVRWRVAFERRTTDQDSDSFDTATEATSAANGTSGICSTVSITCTTIDSIVAGDSFRVRVTRVGTDATNDTMTGDAELVAVELRAV